MNSTRWKLLMAYLPAIASVVNAFENVEVQRQVYETLLGALDEKALTENGLAVSVPLAPGAAVTNSVNGTTPLRDVDPGLEISEGSSIHSLVGKMKV